MSGPQPPDQTEPTVSAEVVRQLLRAVAETADDHPSLGERRRATLTVLTELVQADVGVWAWGRGWPSSAVTPVAHIDIGCSDAQRVGLIEWGMDPAVDHTFRNRVRDQMGTAHAATTLWQDIYSPEEWDAQPPMRRAGRAIAKAGVGASSGTIRPTGTPLLVRTKEWPSLTARSTRPDSLRNSRCDRLSL